MIMRRYRQLSVLKNFKQVWVPGELRCQCRCRDVVQQELSIVGGVRRHTDEARRCKDTGLRLGCIRWARELKISQQGVAKGSLRIIVEV
jgi:hypothetical protein